MKDSELYEQAREIVIKEQKCSCSLLQRKLMIGYMKASNLVYELEEKGIIAPMDGSNPRKVLISQ